MAIARNLFGRGHPVLIRDIDPRVDVQARALGLQVCDSPKALAERCDAVIVVVVNAQQIDEVLFGPDGVTQAVNGARAVLLASTISPQDASRLAAELSSRQFSSIDGPISGGPGRALAGTMSIMLAAPAGVLAEWQSLLRELADKRFVISATHGDAAKAKLVNNLLAGTNLVAAAEALALCTKVGLDEQIMFDVIRASSGASWVFEDRMPRALSGSYVPPHAAAHILTKDLGLATAMADAVAHDTPLGDAALARFREAVRRGWGDLDDAAVFKTYLE